MAELFRGFVEPDLQVRSVGDGRTIYGIAVPWRTPQRINQDLTEQFASGAFDHQLRAANRVWFAREHIKLGGHMIGTTQLMRNDPAGLYVELRASKTPLGDETLELVKDGGLRELSIMFRELQNRRLPNGVIERVKADLREVAVVLQGAYGELAAAAGVRSAEGAAAAEQPSGAFVTPNLDAARQILASLPRLPA